MWDCMDNQDGSKALQVNFKNDDEFEILFWSGEVSLLV